MKIIRDKNLGITEVHVGTPTYLLRQGDLCAVFVDVHTLRAVERRGVPGAAWRGVRRRGGDEAAAEFSFVRSGDGVLSRGHHGTAHLSQKPVQVPHTTLIT
eukprot:393664-Pleurochrysis_carterae.AAC.2